MPRGEKMGLIEIMRRLLRKAEPAKKLLIISTLSSLLNNFCHVCLMAFGSMMVLRSFNRVGGSIRVYSLCSLLSAIGIFLFRYSEGVISHAAAYKLLAEMRVKLYRKLRTLAPACLTDRNKGDILSIAVADIETIEHFFAHTIGPMLTVVVLPVLTIIFAALVHPIFSAILLPIYLLIALVLPMVTVRAGREIGMRSRKALGQLKTLILESVSGIRDIHIFRCGQKKKQEIIRKSKEINKTAHMLIMYQQIVTSMPTFFIYLARLLLVLAAATIAQKSAQDTWQVILLSFIVSAAFSSTQSLISVSSSLLETFAAAERVFFIEDTEPEIVEAEKPLTLEKVEFIDFDNVSFAYDDGAAPILKSINLSISPKDKVGLVGESGIGKSTLLRLLLRFYNPTEGEIRINGVPITAYSLESLRDRIGELEQETFLFNDTVGANIAFGKPGASMDEIREAARKAGIAELIDTLPDGYDTQMGEMGDRLSGGEKQRVGIARLLIRDPDVLVMDEPTSNLDILNEQTLLLTLNEYFSEKIILLASHRTSTLTDCNRIFRIRKGKIAEHV